MGTLSFAKNKPIINAKRSITLHISPSDCRRGKPGDPTGCAAALAALREDGVLSARVHVGRFYVETEDYWLRFQTPQCLRAEIVAIDRGGVFSPGDYHIVPVSPSKRNSGGGVVRREAGKKRLFRHVTANVRKMK
jgi:hypothetical protein